MSVKFAASGRRLPVTEIEVAPNRVLGRRSVGKNGYESVILGVGEDRRPGKSKKGQFKEGLIPRKIREVRSNEEIAVGSQVGADIFKSGDLVKVTGVSKGKGFAGGVKRWGFAGGPKTHGQSDRHRAPGSIGQGTTPGRVLRGKKMAGHLGFSQVTIKNLTVLEVDSQANLLSVIGSIPGHRGTFVKLTKIGENKKFDRVVEVQEEPAGKEAESKSSGAGEVVGQQETDGPKQSQEETVTKGEENATE